MIVYVDASVLLRLLFREAGRIADPSVLDGGVTSALTDVECHRAVDRIRLRTPVPPEQVARRHADVRALLGALELVDMGPAVLARAAAPFSTPLRTLDAIHLATAMLVGLERADAVTMATHDANLGSAARSHGMTLLGA